jgi:hypothetical protein
MQGLANTRRRRRVGRAERSRYQRSGAATTAMFGRRRKVFHANAGLRRAPGVTMSANSRTTAARLFLGRLSLGGRRSDLLLARCIEIEPRLAGRLAIVDVGSGAAKIPAHSSRKGRSNAADV